MVSIFGVTIERVGKTDPLVTGIKEEAQKTKTLTTVNGILTKLGLTNLKSQFKVDDLLVYGSFNASQHKTYLEAIREIEEATGITNMRKNLISESVSGTKVIVYARKRYGGK